MFKPTKKQLEAIKLIKKYRNTLLYGGARSGKSAVLVNAIIYRALNYPNSRHMIARLRFSHAKTSIWHETLIPMLQKHFDKRIWNSNKTDYYIRFANGSEIWLGGFDDKERTEKLLGHEYNTIYFNEVSQIGYEAVEMGLPRLALNTAGCKNKAFFDCNPPSPLHWAHKLFIEKVDPRTGEPLTNAKDYGSMLINPVDNKENLPQDYIESVLMHLSDRMKRRMLYGEWVKPEGTVYEKFSESMIIKQSELPQIEKWSVGVDFGLNMAAVLIGWAGDNVYIVDDITRYNVTTSEFNLLMIERWRDKNYIAYCDPAGGERLQEIKYSRKANNSVEPGIDYINTKIEHGQFYVCDNCTGVLNEIWDYRRDDKERVVKENDHCMDAMRYGIFSEAYCGTQIFV